MLKAHEKLRAIVAFAARFLSAVFRDAVFSYVIIVLALGCTSPAEHGNPLDPASPLYTTRGTLQGQVTTIYQPYQALAGATVQLQPGGLSLQSDAAGRFTFAGLESGEYMLDVTKAGYAARQMEITVLPREQHTVEIRLAGLPFVAAAALTSTRVATREPPTPRLFLEITAEVDDPDGANDIAQVYVNIPGRATPVALQRGSGLSLWRRIVPDDSLKPVVLQNLVGLPLSFIAEDGLGEKSEPRAFQLGRVIDQEPLPTFPIDGEQFPSRTNDRNLRWQLSAISFDYVLRVEVFRLDGGFSFPIFAANNLRAGTNTLPYPGSLTSGTYYWTVKVVDVFGNSSRSKEAPFRVD